MSEKEIEIKVVRKSFAEILNRVPGGREFAEYTKSIYLYKMKNLSLKLEDSVFQETEIIIEKLHKPRNRYINEAIEFYNLLQKRKILSKQLSKESKLVREESMKVLAEFEKLHK